MFVERVEAQCMELDSFEILQADDGKWYVQAVLVPGGKLGPKSGFAVRFTKPEGFHSKENAEKWLRMMKGEA